MLAHNWLEWAEIYLAAAKAGLVAVPINFRLTAPEARFICEDCAISAIIFEEALTGIVAEMHDGTVGMHRVRIGSASPCWLGYEELISSPVSTEPDQSVSPDDPWCLMYTSGSASDHLPSFQTRFLRIADTGGELVDNRRGRPEILAAVDLTLDALTEMLGNDPGERDEAWLDRLRTRHRERRAKSASSPPPQTGADGKIHPMAIFSAIGEVADPGYIAIADGGDLLSFARVGPEASTYMDAGAFGCLGVGLPFAIAAALACPGRQVISVNGGGAYGINAMEIDTAVRHDAKAVLLVSNNAAWNIERYDQDYNYGGRVVGTTLHHSNYVAMARALGAYPEQVEDPTQLAGAIRRGLENAPAVIDVITSQTAVLSDARKGLGFVPDYQALNAWDEAERQRSQNSESL